MTRFEDWLAVQLAEGHSRTPARPWVTLAYAQSLDGSLTSQRGRPTALSGPESMQFTHRLRARHDAILVGIGAVLADNPRLTVRLADGPQPQPVVLDSRLRTPGGAAVLQHPRRPWLAARADADPARRAALEAAGAEILAFPPDESGRTPLPLLLAELSRRGVRSLMVEGGAETLTSFVRGGLADAAALTLAPCFLGGLPVFTAPVQARLSQAQVEAVGEDWLVWGRLG